MSLTGFLAANGKQALLGMKIWEEQTNKAGGLLGRPVKLVYYDDKSAPAEIPGIYTKLLDVDKVDLVLSAYATNDIAPAMPVVMRKGKTFISLFALDVNAQVQLSEIFLRPADRAGHQGLVHRRLLRDRRGAEAEADRRWRSAIADAEFSQNACEGARANAKKLGLKVVYDKSYPPPPKTTDFAPIVRAIKAVECRPRRGVRLSARLGRHGAGGQRNRPDAENVRRRAGRPAGDRSSRTSSRASSTAS